MDASKLYPHKNRTSKADNNMEHDKEAPTDDTKSEYPGNKVTAKNEAIGRCKNTLTPKQNVKAQPQTTL